jgi:subtilisin family serine protease
VLIPDKISDPGVKVAIIDTGANFNTTQYKTIHHKRISDCRTWCDAANISEGRSFMDEKGNTENISNDPHGTHCISVLRKVAPNCTIFVAQVFRGRDDIVDRYPGDDQAQRIASVSASSQIEFRCS